MLEQQDCLRTYVSAAMPWYLELSMVDLVRYEEDSRSTDGEECNHLPVGQGQLLIDDT